MKIWIDIDNSPHVPFFVPIVERLCSDGHDIWITARTYAQTLELLNASGMPYEHIGAHAGKSRAKKILNLLNRARLLTDAAKRVKPDIAVSHGSRAQVLAARVLGIRSLVLFDYESTEMFIFKTFASVLACPSVLNDGVLEASGIPLSKVRWYSGLKEDVYLPRFRPISGFPDQMRWPQGKIIAVVRPSSMVSNYHDRRSEAILSEVIHHIGNHPEVFGYVVPRTSADRRFVEHLLSEGRYKNVSVAKNAADGLQLVFWSDVVFSGGGTMNREAALLGVPTFSLFTGPRPAVDQYLAENGKLSFLEKPEDVGSVQLKARQKDASFRYSENTTLREVCNVILSTGNVSVADG